ncbi:MAG: hypothetical protein CVV14_04165 [Gammaproteobacteria bacterium HGW-Gammaproteobacteria-4]|nr:MAG: hypothetical protein CVV14_04165 [Gammaproteobacteria bacterium HGW-Gammaproteobacteria-4]
MITRTHTIPLAVLGDSDSHSYQDTISFPESTPARGGTFRPITLQWTEVLARLRGERIDLGRWGVWGQPDLVPRAIALFGIKVRKPRKRDYRFNFAVSGATCGDLLGGWREVDSLLDVIHEDMGRWRQGIVVIRIGVNTFATAASLDRLARDPSAPEVTAMIDACVSGIRTTVTRIHALQPHLRIVLVGIFDESHWTKYLDRWQTAAEIANIDVGLDSFDDALRSIASHDPRIAFFDDRAWFRKLWGGRDAQGVPAYRALPIAGMHVTNTSGDDPGNAVLADGHAGLVWNTLWAKALVELLNTEFDVGLEPLTDVEIAAFIQALVHDTRVPE